MKKIILLLVGLVSANVSLALDLEPLASPVGVASLSPRIAQLGDSAAVLTWLEPSQAGHRLVHAVYRDGAFGPPRTISEGRFFANWADTPGLIAAEDGAWFAHWLERSGEGPYAYDIRVSVSADQGLSWSPPVTAHDDGTLTEHGFVSYFRAGPGKAGLVWLDGRETQPAQVDQPPMDQPDGGGHGHGDGSMTLRTVVVDEQLNLTDDALLDGRVCDCCATATALSSEGPVVVYRDRSEAEIRDIAVVRREAAGWSAPLIVHADGWEVAGCPVNGPAIIARGQVVVVAWFTLGNDGVPRVRVAHSDDGARSFMPPQELGTGTALGRVDLAWLDQGFAVTWLDENAAQTTVRLARFRAGGATPEQIDLVPAEGSRASGLPRLGVLQDELLLAWTRSHPQTGTPQVQIGRFSLGRN